MRRDIFRVEAWVIDANGTFNVISRNGVTYPKNFDSRTYDGDVDKALKRAEGDFAEVWGEFCKRDDRQVQTVTLLGMNGKVIMHKSMGAIAPDPDPEPTPEPEEPEEPENNEGE